MIRKWAVEEAYDRGIIELVKSPNNDGVVCKIGEHWFYFGGYAAEKCCSVEEYKAITPEDVIISDIFITLNDFHGHADTEDEYSYYKSYLSEKLKKAFGSDRFRNMCYALYQIDWKESHHISYNEEKSMIKSYYMEYLPSAGRKPMSYQEYMDNGMSYVCFEDFIAGDYQNEKYMKSLLHDDTLFSVYKRDVNSVEHTETN